MLWLSTVYWDKAEEEHKSHTKPTHGRVVLSPLKRRLPSRDSPQSLDLQVLSVVASSRPLSRPFHPRQTVTSPRVGGFEHWPLFWPCFIYCAWNSSTAPTFLRQVRRLRKRSKKKLNLPEIEISVHRDEWGKEILEDKSGYLYSKDCSDFF